MIQKTFFEIEARFSIYYIFLTFGFFSFFACSPTKYLKKDEHLLVKSELEIVDDKKVSQFYPEDYIRQKPNKKMLGVAFYARIYNLVDPEKEAKREAKRKTKEDKINRKRLEKGKEPREKMGFGKWLRKIGEAPVIFDRLQMRKSSQQITALLKNKGYYNAKTTDSVAFKGKTASVKYEVMAGKPYRIRNYTDSIEDPEVAKLLNSYFESKSKIKEGKRVDVGYFGEEREQINEIMLENGYYRFAKEYIFFQVDTFIGNNQADIKILIKSPEETNEYGQKNTSPHKKYYFNDITIYPDHQPKSIIKKKQQTENNYDTVPGDKGVTFMIAKKNKYTKAVLTRGVTMTTDSIYRASKAKGSFAYYNSLSNFRLINFDFQEENHNNTGDTGRNYLYPHIKLTPQTKQSLTLELEGNMTSKRYGAAANVLYRNINLFGGAEILDVKGSVELNNQEEGFDDKSYFSDTEWGIASSIRFPNLVMPFSSRNFYLRFFPKTAFSLGYNFRHNSNYRRSIFSSSYGYDWRASEKSAHLLNVMEFSSVKLSRIDSTYLVRLDSVGQFEEKYDHLILGSSYTITYNTQKITKSKDFHYIMFRLEPAGNLINLIHNATKSPKLGYGEYKRNVEAVRLGLDHNDSIVNARVAELNEERPGFNTLFNLPYAQYLKSEVDFRYYQILNSKNEIVYRINPGIIVPYGNSFYSPQEKRFFLGGASSMRAWQARRLGPGSFKDTLGLYQYGDLKLEMNLEYRFKLFWMIEGALFADAGNIWSMAKYEAAEEKKFKPKSFYKEIALGSGVGVRMDFTFFVFRFDFGVRIYDPSVTEGKSPWLGMDAITNTKDYGITINFGIGYPF